MVTAMVTAFSYLYISQILRLRITNANETRDQPDSPVGLCRVTTPCPTSAARPIDTSNPAAVRRALADYLQTDVALNNLLQSDPGDWSFIYDVSHRGRQWQGFAAYQCRAWWARCPAVARTSRRS